MRSRITFALVIIILLVATFTRFHKLEAQSFWNDEGNSARLSERSIPLIIEGTASDVHPPGYYLALRGWRELVGETEFGLRALSAFAGVLVVAGTMTLARELGNAKEERGKEGTIGILVAGMVTAVSPPLVYYSQEARMYSLLSLWAVLSTWLLLLWLQISNQLSVNGNQLSVNGNQFSVNNNRYSVSRRRWGVVTAYILVAAAGLYTQYFFIPILLIHNVIVLIWLVRKRRRLFVTHVANHPYIQWALMMFATFLLYLPWFSTFLRHSGRAGSGSVAGLLDFLLPVMGWLPFGATIPVTAVPWPLLAVWVLAVLGLVGAGRRGLLAFLGVAAPPLFMAATGATGPQFYKFLVVSVPFLGLLLGSGFIWWRAVRPLPTVLLIVVLWGNAQSLDNLYNNPAYARADYRGIVAQIAAEDHPSAGVILNAPNQWEVFTYYHDEADAPVYPLPRGHASFEALQPELEAIATRHDRVYALFWGDAQQDPQRWVERWLDEHAFKAREEWVQDVRFVTYAVPPEPVIEMETAVGAQFGRAIILEGYTLQSKTMARGDILQVTLFWQTAESLDTRYKVFLHLLDENGQLVAQRDSEPGGGLALTTTWTPEETIRDNHGIAIPTNAAIGIYTLRLGLYNIADPAARLPVQTAAETSEALPLTTIRVIKR